MHYIIRLNHVRQYRIIGLTPMAVGLSQSLAQQSGTVSRISSGTRQSALTLSDIYWRCICLRDTSAFSALEVDNFMRYINLLTYLLTYNINKSTSPRTEALKHMLAVSGAAS